MARVACGAYRLRRDGRRHSHRCCTLLARKDHLRPFSRCVRCRRSRYEGLSAIERSPKLGLSAPPPKNTVLREGVAAVELVMRRVRCQGEDVKDDVPITATIEPKSWIFPPVRSRSTCPRRAADLAPLFTECVGGGCADKDIAVATHHEEGAIWMERRSGHAARKRRRARRRRREPCATSEGCIERR